jgi:hypothetical protein
MVYINRIMVDQYLARHGRKLAYWELAESIPALVYTKLHENIQDGIENDVDVISAYNNIFTTYNAWVQPKYPDVHDIKIHNNQMSFIIGTDEFNSTFKPQNAIIDKKYTLQIYKEQLPLIIHEGFYTPVLKSGQFDDLCFICSIVEPTFASYQITDWTRQFVVIACSLARIAVYILCKLSIDMLRVDADERVLLANHIHTSENSTTQDIVILLTSLMYTLETDRLIYVKNPLEIPTMIESLRLRGVPIALCDTMQDVTTTPLELYNTAIREYIALRRSS